MTFELLPRLKWTVQRSMVFVDCFSESCLNVFDIKNKQECEKRGGWGNQGKSRRIKKIKFNQGVISD